MPEQPFVALDIGSNSIKLRVAEPADRGNPVAEPIVHFDQIRVSRLAAGLEQTGILNAPAIDRRTRWGQFWRLLGQRLIKIE